MMKYRTLIPLLFSVNACTIAPTTEDYLGYPKQNPVYVEESYTLYRPEIECVANLIQQSPLIKETIKIAIGNMTNVVGESASLGLVPSNSGMMIMSALSHLSHKIKIVTNVQYADYTIGGNVSEINELGNVDGGISVFGFGAKGSYELLRVATDMMLTDLKKGEISSYPLHNYLKYKEKMGGSVFVLIGSSFSDANFNQQIISPVSFGIRENIEKTLVLMLSEILFQKSGGQESALSCQRTPFRLTQQATPHLSVQIENVQVINHQVHLDINNQGDARPLLIDFIYFNSLTEIVDQYNTRYYISAHQRTPLKIKSPHPANYLEVKIHDHNNKILANKTISLVDIVH